MEDSILILGIILLALVGYLIYKDNYLKVLKSDIEIPCDACDVKEKYSNHLEFIDDVFAYLSKNDKILLEGTCDKVSYQWPDVDYETEMDLKVTIRDIMKHVNESCCSVFILKDFNLLMTESNKVGKRSVVDFMISETVKHYSLRIVVDFVELNGKKYLNYIETIPVSVYNLQKPPANSSQSFQSFSQYTNNQQSLYPEDVSQFDSDWLGRLRSIFKENYNVVGVDDKTTLVFNPVEFEKKHEVFSLIDMNKWIVPFNQLGKYSGFCKNACPGWDRFGANMNVTPKPEGCELYNTSLVPQNVVPNKMPGIGVPSVEYQNPNNSVYARMFDPARGNIHIAGHIGA